MKATSIFGGVQVFNIFITLIRGKFVAILIGTAGMGLNGLLLSGLNLIKTFTSLGVAESAVKDIAKAHNSNDKVHIRTTFQVFKRLIWFTAIFGIIATIVFSPLLSKFAFGDTSKTISFMWLSITFVFGALSGGIYTLLRGTRQLKYLAQANIFGGIVGLIVALPLFYFYGIDGVVPAIILTAFANYLVSLYFKSKIKFEPIAVSWQDTFQLGKPIVQLGLSLTLINILAAGVAFTLNAFISKTGTLSDVGLYSAGNAIVEGYVGMVFTAMATDYFPRLAGVISDELKWKKLVNEQAELVLIILGIVLVLLITTTPLLIRILLSKEFLASQNFIQFAVLAIPLKGLVWVVGYIILAKGNNKLFLTVEIIANLIVLGFNLLFYHFFGLTGLGISLILSYLISSFFMLFILKNKYGFQFNFGVYKLLSLSLVTLSLCLLSVHLLENPYMYIAEILIVLFVISYFTYEFNQRISIKSILEKFKNR
ncbi:MAG: oligosaccharide flippase family protein [Bacteroidetes bacterium]|uniref:oligosaccharide flippase family protein n=1 Tax=Flavobacterium sp. TaxID=239 RepID=UPI002FD87CA2|nr:oligosaccharide flippase family protein [Bacteroidota bacterium]